MFPINDQFANYASIQFFANRYKELDISAVESYLAVVRIASHMNRGSDAYFQRLELSQGRFMVMMILLRAGDAGMSPAELAQNISCARATVTGLLDTLESSGWVERQADPSGDRRSLTVRLTAAGRQKLDSILPDHYQRIAQAMADFSADERKQLTQLIQKFGRGLAVFESTISNQAGDVSPENVQAKKEVP
ncbi:MAG: MarR family transcriptional regulator [Proteobacteria bacterium]|nr:MarR family transcriptional regulator [Pseudomonadota bacterium]